MDKECEKGKERRLEKRKKEKKKNIGKEKREKA